MSAPHGTSEALNRRLSELLIRSRSLEDELRQPLDADSTERATDLADDDALSEVDAVLLHEIAEIRQTLLRIERGEYGACLGCGEAIGDARLAALPTASLCLGCAANQRSSSA